MKVKRFRSAKGSTLIWVLLIFIFLSALGAVLLTTSYSAFTNTNTLRNSQQAYFTARSAAQSFVKYLVGNAGSDSALSQVVNASPPASDSDGASESLVGTGSVNGMGNYLVSAWYTDSTDAKIKVMARGTYAGAVSTLYATLNKTSGTSPDPNQNPLNSLICVNGGTISQSWSNLQSTGDIWIDPANQATWMPVGNINTTGDVYVNAPLNLTNGNISARRVMVNGNITLDQGRTLTGYLSTTGSLSVGSGTVNFLSDTTSGTPNTVIPIDGGFYLKSGTIKANDNSTRFTIDSSGNDTWDNSGGTVTADVVTTKDAQMSNGTLNGNMTCGGNMLFDQWSGDITGALRYGSLTISQNTTVNRFVPGGNAAKNTGAVSVTSASLPIGFANTLNVITAPTIPKPPVGSITWVPINQWSTTAASCTITDDCTISSATLNDSSQFGFFPSRSSNSFKIYVNTATKDKDIHIKIDSTNILLDHNDQFIVSGPHRVLIYLVGNGAGLSLGANASIRMQDYSQSRIFIIGTAPTDIGQTVSETSDSRIDGYVYMPNGTFSYGSSGLTEGSTTCGFYGSVTARNMNISSSCPMIYSSPFLPDLLPGTGLDQESYGTIPTAASLTFGGWSDS